MKSALIFLVVLALIGGGATYYGMQLTGEPPANFRTVPVNRDDVVATITATGTLEPVELVDVGAQVSGLIQSLGEDRSPQSITGQIDYNSMVEKGTLLAQIDPRMYQAQVDQARATRDRSKADLLQLEAKCDQTEKELNRAEALLPKKAIADTDYDLAKANFKVAKANVEVGKATIAQYEAALQMAQTNLNYTTIVSPVKGQVITRRVNIGQTVVSTQSASSMFLIAKDLSQMQVWSSVSEADMGRIHVGTPVRFTVDAFSDETFEGKVAQIRLDATVSQNVVTYTIVVSTDNSNRRLLPYLTANLKFEYDRRDNVLVVPNAALRWRPRLPSQIAPDAREDATSGTSASEGGRKTASADGAPNAADGKKSDKSRENRDRLWVKEGDFVRPLEVQTGLTDGSVTEVSGEGVKEELQVVMGESRSAAGDVGDAKNPFLPTIRPGMRPR